MRRLAAAGILPACAGRVLAAGKVRSGKLLPTYRILPAANPRAEEISAAGKTLAASGQTFGRGKIPAAAKIPAARAGKLWLRAKFRLWARGPNFGRGGNLPGACAGRIPSNE